MPRRKTSLFEDLVHVPWWMGVGVAVVLYIFGAVFVPAILSTNDITQALTPAFQNLVYLIAFLCLLSAIISVIRSWWQGELFHKMAKGQSLESLSWRDFEHMLAGAFRQQGYLVADNPPGPDDGIDLRLRKGRETFYVQAKHWKHKPVGVSIVRELHGVVSAGGADCGIVVASSGFTPDAKAFARKAGVQLVGPAELRRWFAGKSAPEAPRREPHVSIPDTSQPPLCGKCTTQMTRRTARRGPNAGKAFWGCTNFPKCRETQAID